MKKKIQQRQVVITEFSDGTFEIDGEAWKLEVKESEVEDAFCSWRRGLLKENIHFDNRKPKLLEQ